MLFAYDKLKSIYDFGEKMPEAISLDSVAKEILRITDELFNIFSENNQDFTKLALKHKDILGTEISVDMKSIEKIWDRTETDIINILYRPPSKDKSSIASSLARWGLRPPEGFRSDKKIEPTTVNYTYLQILYFFYMIRNFVFPEDNFFLQINEKRISSDYSPIPGSGRGFYWGFINENLFDCEISIRKIGFWDNICTSWIHKITEKITEIISEKNSVEANIERVSNLRQTITEVCAYADVADFAGKAQDSSVVQLLALSYRYQLKSYASDMVVNLQSNKMPFNFPELDFDINKTWGKIPIPAEEEEIGKFLDSESVIEFCKQKKIKKGSRLDKEIRGAIVSFVCYIIEYDKTVCSEFGKGLFTKFFNGYPYINADILAIIVRTFFDIKDNKEDFVMFYKSGDKWRKKQRFNSMLTERGANSIGLLQDLAVRLFIVAFHSEYLNVYAGHGYYYPLFQKIYLQHYLLIQEIVNAVFSSAEPEEWFRQLIEIYDKIK